MSELTCMSFQSPLSSLKHAFQIMVMETGVTWLTLATSWLRTQQHQFGWTHPRLPSCTSRASRIRSCQPLATGNSRGRHHRSARRWCRAGAMSHLLSADATTASTLPMVAADLGDAATTPRKVHKYSKQASSGLGSTSVRITIDVSRPRGGAVHGMTSCVVMATASHAPGGRGSCRGQNPCSQLQLIE